MAKLLKINHPKLAQGLFVLSVCSESTSLYTYQYTRESAHILLISSNVNPGIFYPSGPGEFAGNMDIEDATFLAIDFRISA